MLTGIEYKRKIKDKINKIHFVYKLLGSLRRMFWVCVVLFIFQAAWEAVIFTSMATFLQSLIDTTKYSGGDLPSGKFLGFIYGIFQQIPEDKRVLAGFFFTTGSMLISNLINMGVTTYQTKFSMLFIYGVRSDSFSNLCRNSLRYFDNNKKGEMLQMVINETRACYSVLKSFLDLLIFVLKATVCIVFMVMFSFKLSLIVMVFCLLFLTENYFMSKIIKRLGKIVVDMTRSLTVVTDESIEGIKHIKLLNFYKRAESSFKRSCWDADSSNRKSSLIMQWQTTISNFLVLMNFVVLVYFSMKYSILAVSLLITFLYILQKLNQAITGINQKYGFINSNIHAMNKIINFFREVDTFKEKSGSFIKKEFLKEKITCKGVSLNYGRGEVLEGISLDIYKGQTMALVGESGAGKTSLANLFVRLYDINEGEILIDGVDIKAYDLAFLRSRIGVVNQDTIIFNTTIRENIMMGNPDASEEEMIEAAENAYAHDFIMKMPQGYGTLVGDRGLKLSGGQKQRINIAQIFLKNPELMILDEATSALDTKSEQFIQSALEKLIRNRTCIIIAHRLSTVRNADKIVVLDKGRIIEQGSWTALFEKKGAFYNMVQRQSFVKE